MKRYLFILALVGLCFASYSRDSDKKSQTINFKSIPEQYLSDSATQLEASSTSGLSVIFTSSDESIAVIEGNQAVFKRPGKVFIRAAQPGDSIFYEATTVSGTLTILPDVISNTRGSRFYTAALAISWVAVLIVGIILIVRTKGLSDNTKALWTVALILLNVIALIAFFGWKFYSNNKL
jgi:hypothetical protein